MESGGNTVARGQLHFSMPSIGGAYRRAPQRTRPGPRVLPSPLLLVSGPGPAWIMPLPGTFMRRRHVPRPECMAPPRTARPQPGGEVGRIRAGFWRVAPKRALSATPPARPRSWSRTPSRRRSRHVWKLNSASQEPHRPLREDPHRAHRRGSRARGENPRCTPFPSPTAGRALVRKVRHALVSSESRPDAARGRATRRNSSILQFVRRNVPGVCHRAESGLNQSPVPD